MCYKHALFREWSIIMGRGGLQIRGGGYKSGSGGWGQVKFYPYEKGGGAKKVLGETSKFTTEGR